MNKKLKGFSLIEVIIAVFVLSLITLGLMNSILSHNKISKKQHEKVKMISIAESIIEKTMAKEEINYNIEEKYDLNTHISETKNGLKKIVVIIKLKETDDEIKLISYY